MNKPRLWNDDQPDKQEEKVEILGEKYLEALLVDKRIIFLHGEINEKLVEEVTGKLIGMALMSRKTPIIMEINSCGGLCLGGLCIIDTMKRVGCPIYTVISGYAASMASFISICGNVRLMTPNAYYMMHPMTTGDYDYLPFVKDRVAFGEELDTRLTEIYKANTKLPNKIIEKAKHGEVWMTSKDCLKYKIVDKII